VEGDSAAGIAGRRWDDDVDRWDLYFIAEDAFMIDHA